MRMLCLCVWIFSCTICFSQATLPTVIPPSPNAATLGKYGEIPVSLYSGTADISIPLYTLESGDISVPISISYHTGGIRLSEQAGWIGLGWALNASGVISRNLMHNDDLHSFELSRKELATVGQVSPMLQRISTDGSAWKYTSDHGEVWDYTNEPKEALDFEYDIFSFNFLGRSGKFIVNRKGEVVLEKAADLVVAYSKDTGTFKVVDERGLAYYFDDIEWATVNDRPITYATSWYLTRIESPAGDRVNFSYIEANPPSKKQEIGSHRVGCRSAHPPRIDVSFDNSFKKVLVLTKITTDRLSVDFPNDDLREDYTSKKITGVRVLNGTQVLKEFSFAYSYFNGDITTTGKYKRLRLDKVFEKAGSTTLPPHEFSYYEMDEYKSLQDIDSYSFDHWGFFNGKPNSDLVLPAFNGYATWGVGYESGYGKHYVEFEGANRKPNPDYMKLFSLKEVKYPTGGKTKLTLEANTYNPIQFSYSQEPQLIDSNEPIHMTSTVVGSIAGTTDAQNAYGDVKASIAFRCNSNQCGALHTNFYEKIYCEVGGLRRDIGGMVDCPDGQNICTADLTLQAGIIPWKIYIDPSVTDTVYVSIGLTWKEKEITASKTEKFLYAGGLRIKKVENLDSDGKTIQSKEYQYHYGQDDGSGKIINYSYGKIMSFPTYYRYELSPGQQPGSVCITFARMSSSFTPANFSVGYSQVTEFVVDNAGQKAQGKTVYNYVNMPDSLYRYAYYDLANNDEFYIENMQPPGLPSLSYPINGTQILQKQYRKTNSGYQRVKEVVSEYDNPVVVNYFGIRFETETFDSGTRMTYTYPAFRSQRILRRKDTEIIYDLNDSTRALKTIVRYDYNKTHEQAIQKTVTDSEGRNTITKSIFPQDYGTLTSSSYGIKNLVDKNVVASPVEQYTMVQQGSSTPVVTGGTLTTYKYPQPLADQIHVLELTAPLMISDFDPSNKTANTFTKNPLYKARILFRKYDDKGNILNITKSDDANIAYIWGYDKTYPIAEVKNAQDFQIFHTSFEEETINVTSTSKTGLKGYTAAYTVVLPSSNTFKLSYWKKVGTADWQYVESFVSSNTTIGGTGIIIDEVRLFPSGSQMTTYTYDVEGRMLSTTDPSNITTYFVYDALGRLTAIKDDNNNILKKYDYNYQLR